MMNEIMFVVSSIPPYNLTHLLAIQAVLKFGCSEYFVCWFLLCSQSYLPSDDD